MRSVKMPRYLPNPPSRRLGRRAMAGTTPNTLNRTFGGWPSTSCFGRGLILGSNAGKRLYEAVTLAGEGFTVLANMDAVRGFPAAEAAGFPGNVEQAIGSVLGLKVLVAL